MVSGGEREVCCEGSPVWWQGRRARPLASRYPASPLPSEYKNPCLHLVANKGRDSCSGSGVTFPPGYAAP